MPRAASSTKAFTSLALRVATTFEPGSALRAQAANRSEPLRAFRFTTMAMFMLSS